MSTRILPHFADHPITVETDSFKCHVKYLGTKERLINAGLATAEQFPGRGKYRKAKYKGYPVDKAKNNSGLEWAIYRIRGSNLYSLYYSNSYLCSDAPWITVTD